jgi:lipoyl(octanoyl) transferase
MTRDRRRTPAHEMRAAGDAPVAVVSPGLVPYATAWDWQRDLVARRSEDEVGDALLLLQHPRVYTAGKRADEANLVFDAAERDRRGIELFHVDRGGDFTYHGPGQLVGYPVLRLRGPFVVDYVRTLEDVLIDVARTYDLDAHRVDGMTGVWVGDEKLVAIGVRVSSRYVTNHGFALNVHTDLTDFTGIIPCGIEDKGVASLASLGVDTTMDEVERRVREAFADTLGCTLVPATADDLGLAAPAPEPGRTSPASA